MKNILYGFSTFLLAITSTLVGKVSSELDTLQQIECSIKPMTRVTSHHLHHRRHDKHPQHLNDRKHSTHPHIRLGEGASLNWSGYAAVTSLSNPAKDSVTAASGSWTVPMLSPLTGNTYCSIWVGIDGYSNKTVEQIGTEHDWSRGTQKNYAWFEMYPSGAYQIIGFPVDINDKIGAEVIYQGENTFQLTLINYTKNVSTVIPSGYTKSKNALRSSAEWIVEAPSSSSRVLPLANFGTVAFTNCLATINGFAGPINSIHWIDDQLTMETQSGIIKSLPSDLCPTGECFSLTWEHE